MNENTNCDFIALDEESRTHVETDAAAWYLLRKPQTLRIWACKETGPIRPVRVNGRLAWPMADIRRIMRGAS